MKHLLPAVLMLTLSGLPLHALYAPEVILPEEKMADMRKGTSALKSLPRDLREAYIAEKLGLCFLPTGGSAYQSKATDGTLEGIPAHYYYAYTAAVFVGSDGKVYGLRDTQKKKNGRPKDEEAVKRALKAIYGGNAEAVFSGLAEEITQMCVKTAKNRLDAMPQAMRDCYLAELDDLFYLPGGKNANTKKKGTTHVNGTDVIIEFDQIESGAKFVDSNGEEQDRGDVVDHQRKSRELYSSAWMLAHLCATLAGKDEILQIYPREVKAMRKYRKDINAYGAPKASKKPQQDAPQSKPKKPEVSRCVSALSAMPRQMREAYLAERMGLCFMPTGSAAYDKSWIITTREGLRVRNYPAHSGARYVGSKGKEFDFYESIDKKSGKASERLKKLATEAIRGLYSSDEDAIIDAFSKDITEMTIRTAKDRLYTMPAPLRAAFLAEEGELIFMPDGSDPYTGNKGRTKVSGCDRELEWREYHEDAHFIDPSGKELSMKDDIPKHLRKHMDTWLLTKWCSQLAGKKAVLDIFADDVAAMRQHYEAAKNK